jgi:transcriptional regulator with XRE-family HTH domain
MIEFGTTLRLAREAKGLSTSEIAEKTHLLVQIVEDLENENFSRIPAPIYGRGFIKLYCEAVDIPDPAPLIAEFMEIYNGNRPAVIKMKRPAPAPVPAPEPEPATEPAPEPEPATEPEPAAAQTDSTPAPEPLSAGRNHYSRYAMPLPPEDEDETRFAPSFRVPPAVWRMLALAAAAGLLLYLAYRLLAALCSLATGTPAPAAEQTDAAPRTPLDIPALYID